MWWRGHHSGWFGLIRVTMVGVWVRGGGKVMEVVMLRQKLGILRVCEEHGYEATVTWSSN